MTPGVQKPDTLRQVQIPIHREETAINIHTELNFFLAGQAMLYLRGEMRPQS